VAEVLVIWGSTSISSSICCCSSDCRFFNAFLIHILCYICSESVIGLLAVDAAHKINNWNIIIIVIVIIISYTWLISSDGSWEWN
jgi:hypothetical protein